MKKLLMLLLALGLFGGVQLVAEAAGGCCPGASATEVKTEDAQEDAASDCEDKKEEQPANRGSCG
jgi:hypothetical protein